MEPIISPLWFYLIDTVTSLKVVFIISGIMFTIVLFFVSFCSDNIEDWINFWKGKGKIGLASGLFLIIIGCFIPCTETAYKMLVAFLVTPDNLAIVGDSVSSVVDYIIESVDKLIESNQ